MAQERILIVDDEPYVRTTMAGVLERANYRPVLAYTRSEAAAHLENDDPYDLILFDLVMNGRDGPNFLERAQALCPDTPLVVVTGMRDVSAVISAMRERACDYLLKPVDGEQLLSSVQRAIEHRRVVQKNAEEKEKLEKLVVKRTDMLQAAVQELEQAYDITLEALGDALDLKDAETEGHSRRVTAYTIALARAMGLKGESIRNVARGAFLHDIGKMAIPDAILLKPGKLDAQEQQMMREHCARGYDILRKIPFLQDAAQIVYSHQEHYDGTGYPRRLKGEQIVLGARIFAIADTLDAITSDRPYRRADSFDAARQEILRCSGTQFDPQVVKVFEGLPNQIWEGLQVEITQSARMATLTSK